VAPPLPPPPPRALPLPPAAQAPCAHPPPGADAPSELLRRVALVLLGLTAFASLLAEIAWTRVLVMIVGGSTYAFTLVLLVFLLGIGLGSASVARRSTTAAETAAAAALAQGVTAAGAALLFIFFSVLPVYIIAVFQIQFLDATSRLLLMGLAVGFVVLIPSIGMGMTFPLLADLVARRDGARGADVGRAYALNTVGSIAGAVLTGFVFVVVLGTDITLRLGLVITALAALALAALAARGVAEASAEHRRLRVRVLGGGALAVVGLVTALAAPRWSTRLIDLGPTIYARHPMNQAALRTFLQHRGVRQLDYREGWNATVSVWESEGNKTLKVNGKADASDQGDMDTQIMVGLGPLAARPDAASALVIGYGSGVTARVVADAPGMRRVRVVELEPAVLAMDRHFRHVNDSVLFRPTVTAVVDDARGALQLTAERFDVIMSEPSNPWVAGIATLYTPEFYRIVRSRLAPDGVFGQWIQLYQLPMPVLAGIVRNLRAVFPYVEIWFGGPHDLVVLGAARPFAYDRVWLERLLGPGTALGALGREWLGMTQSDDYFGRLVMRTAGVMRLVERATLTHTDDRPQLEFVAARRFLDGDAPLGLLDSLLRMRPPEDAEGMTTSFQLARAFGARRTDSRGLPLIEAAQRAQPDEPEWAVRAAVIHLALGDTAAAEAALAGVLRRHRYPEALLVSGMLAARGGDPSRARSLLGAALAAGADTGQARAALAVLAVRGGRWDVAAREIRGALATPRWTFRHPFPRDLLGDALGRFAFEGPAATADSLLGETIARKAGWARLYELRGLAALRAGACEVAAESFLQLLDFAVERLDGPRRMTACWSRRTS
ncbi:MAG: spermidine synthase, partial [Gemmatimonadales bacterium]